MTKGRDRRVDEIAADVEQLRKGVEHMEERVAGLAARLEAIEGISSTVRGMDARLLRVELEATTLDEVADLQRRIEALEAGRTRVQGPPDETDEVTAADAAVLADLRRSTRLIEGVVAVWNRRLRAHRQEAQTDIQPTGQRRSGDGQESPEQ